MKTIIKIGGARLLLPNVTEKEIASLVQCLSGAKEVTVEAASNGRYDSSHKFETREVVGAVKELSLEMVPDSNVCSREEWNRIESDVKASKLPEPKAVLSESSQTLMAQACGSVQEAEHLRDVRDGKAVDLPRG